MGDTIITIETFCGWHHYNHRNSLWEKVVFFFFSIVHIYIKLFWILPVYCDFFFLNITCNDLRSQTRKICRQTKQNRVCTGVLIQQWQLRVPTLGERVLFVECEDAIPKTGMLYIVLTWWAVIGSLLVL